MSIDKGQPDVAIIGAGPAGCTAAIQLARAGLRTLVVERKHFPREKVCGGCLSGAATRRLEELMGAQDQLPGVPTQSLLFVFGRYRIACKSSGSSRIVHRSVLDEWLARQAIANGAEIRFGQSAYARPSGCSWEVVAGRDIIRPRTVLVACGLNPWLRCVEHQHSPRQLLGQMWLQPAVSPLPVNGNVEMHWLRGGYVGLATVGSDCIVALAAQISAGHNPCELLRASNPRSSVWHYLEPDAPRRFNARGIAGFPWRPNRLGMGNLLLLGDAAGFEEPYTGEGMSQAIHSADCAVAAVLGSDNPVANYTKLMHRRHRRTMRRTRLLRRCINLPAVHALAAMPPLIPPGFFARLIKHIHLEGPQHV